VPVVDGCALVPVVDGLGGSLGSVGVGAKGEGTPLKEVFLMCAGLAVRGEEDRDTSGDGGGLILDGPERGSAGRPKGQLFDGCFPVGVVRLVVGVGAGGRGELT
jgi:hypothetical protein